MQVKRARKLTIVDRLYLPSIFSGLVLTFKHIFRKKDTLQYPEQKHAFGPRYRGVPALVHDQDGREKCVACYMCQWVCPPLAITIEAAEYPPGHTLHAIEKFPAKFDINMLRCIYCGLCEEACPEEAIFMSKTYVVVGHARDLMIFDKTKLYEIGGTRHDEIKKWAPEQKGEAARSHRDADQLAVPGASH
jgi:NADH-quinone oxidoreductase subunit I